MLFKVTITKIIEWECEPVGDDGDKETERNDEIVESILEDLPKFVDGVTWDITEMTR